MLYSPTGEPILRDEKAGAAFYWEKTVYMPKPYQQMTYPRKRIQIDVKVVLRRYIAVPELRLLYAAIGEFSRKPLPKVEFAEREMER